MAAASEYASGMFDRLASRLGQKSKKDETDPEKEEEDCPVLEFDPHLFESQPLELPSSPENLSSLQVVGSMHLSVTILSFKYILHLLFISINHNYMKQVQLYCCYLPEQIKNKKLV